ncbi:hypothetical protein SAMN05444166_5957 [Singulisphaera sp. GP187]|uniref:hypothetical protein n=1 Tax=Singulisphaera sp. GP187 TaxID=1882752 RepID=UPI000929779A|nr:hypothetical protein [Singulisphaera sp. GP187]SIO59189.1 hypothetical protein SAMN05444166_5957 [Singulisphaera sp. GP187]
MTLPYKKDVATRPSVTTKNSHSPIILLNAKTFMDPMTQSAKRADNLARKLIPIRLRNPHYHPCQKKAISLGVSVAGEVPSRPIME